MKLALIKTIINTIIFTLFIMFIVLTAKTHASEWTPETFKKQQVMIKFGWKEKSTVYAINKCKSLPAKYLPANCVLIMFFISCGESSCTKNARNNNILGIERKWKGVKFASEEEAIDFWLGQYKKYWYKWALPIHYYWPNPKTKYCFPEKANNWGQYGLKNATRAYNYFISNTK
jgi:hypothetical protein